MLNPNESFGHLMRILSVFCADQTNSKSARPWENIIPVRNLKKIQMFARM